MSYFSSKVLRCYLLDLTSQSCLLKNFKDCQSVITQLVFASGIILKLRFFQLLYLESGFLSVAYLTVANLARLGISVHCQVPVRSQYLVRLLSQCWITGGRTIHPPIEGLTPNNPQLPPTPNPQLVTPRIVKVTVKRAKSYQFDILLVSMTLT